MQACDGAAQRSIRRWPWLTAKIGIIVAVAVFMAQLFSGELRQAIHVPRLPDFAQEWLQVSNLEARLRDLLQRARSGAPGSLAADVAELGRDLAPSGLTAFLVDAEGTLLFEPPGLSGLPRGGRLGLGLLSVLEEGAVVGVALVEPLPLWEDGRLAAVGGVVRVLFGPRSKWQHRGAEAPDEERTVTLEPTSPLAAARMGLATSVEEVVAQLDSGNRSVRTIMALLVALVTGAGVALLVTRRVRRLARQAKSGGEHGIPGPFHDAGRDELGELAAVLTSMRQQALELVEGLRLTDRRRREWIAELSHDFRTPLGALGIALERASTALEAGDHDRAARMLEAASHDTQRLKVLLADLLELGRLELSDELQREAILPRELLQSALTAVAPFALARGVQLEQVTDGECQEIHADGSRLLRAIENLLSNAVRECAGRVVATVASSHNVLTVTIEDDGRGFGSGEQGEPIDLSVWLASRPHQRGLGLRVAERVARAHGGSITVGAREPSGAKLTLRIPSSPG